MQDPMGFQYMKAPAFPEQEQLKCPRCDSTNTKFCYYNNYNLSQPRHFCKNCRRYWTKGGALRNIPVGGGTRKSNKRSSSNDNNPECQYTSAADPTQNQKFPKPSPTPTTSSTFRRQVVSSSAVQNSGSEADPTRMYVFSVDHQVDMGGNFRSVLAGPFGNIVQGLNPNGSGLKKMQTGDLGGNLEDSGGGMNQDSGRDPDL